MEPRMPVGSDSTGKFSPLVEELSPGPSEFTLGLLWGSHLGDQLCLTPLPRLLKTAFGTRVYVNDTPVNRAIFKHNPYVEGFRRTPRTFHKLVAKGYGHHIQRLARGFGVAFEGDPKPEVYLTDEERQWALRERTKWRRDRPVCIFSLRALSSQGYYQRVDWHAVGGAWMKWCTAVQPVLTTVSAYTREVFPLSRRHREEWRPEHVLAGAVVYENLTLRQYMSLFSVADYFCGVLSGGAHVAAAFGLPSLVIVWRDLFSRLRLPSCENGHIGHCYTSHVYISCDMLYYGQVNDAYLEECVWKVRCCQAERHAGGQMSIGSVVPTRVAMRLIKTERGRIVRMPTI